MENEKRRRKRSRILIAGLGNVLLGDDGVGVHVVRELKKLAMPGALVVEVGTAVLDALQLLEWADKVLVIDSMEAGGPPGTIYSFGVEDVADPGHKASLHELSFLCALRFLPNSQKPQVAILGVEPETIDYGLNLSPALQAVMPQLIRAVEKRVVYWRKPFSSPSYRSPLQG